MRLYPTFIQPRSFLRHTAPFSFVRLRRRSLVTLAIETSCDDTSVAVVEKKVSQRNGKAGAIIHFHKKVTSNNNVYRGIHPLISLQSHQENLAGLVQEAIAHLPEQSSYETEHGLNSRINGDSWTRRPDFVSVTRGPGMLRSNLFTGLDTAKGLAVAWQVPLVGVHHMQAHALTPRLVTALQNVSNDALSLDQTEKSSSNPSLEPSFPFLSVLASGGHTLLVQSASLTDHRVLASTSDVAVGECLDKVARVVLPYEILQHTRSTMYGALLEQFAFPTDPINSSNVSDMDSITEAKCPTLRSHYAQEDSTANTYRDLYATNMKYNYKVPRNGEEEIHGNATKWGWAFNQPLSKAGGGLKSKSLEMSFSGLTTAVERTCRFKIDHSTGKPSTSARAPEEISIEERRDMAREAMRAAFEHVASRVVLGLKQCELDRLGSSSRVTVVMSGGVAANKFLRYILASTLIARGYPDVRIVFPPPSLCTDNAAMIAWTALEMYEAGHRHPYSIRAIRKWPLNQLLFPPQDE